MTIARDLSYVAALVASSSANVVFDDTIVLNGGTANGVLYLDSNKVVTTGSALRFDGSKFRVAAPSGVNMEVYETSTGNFNRIVISQQNTVSTYNSTYSTGTGAHAWQIGNAEYMRLDSSGNLLIGHSAAQTNGKLQVTGSIGTLGNSQIRQATNSDGNTLQVFATQVVAGTLNSTSYGYSGGALLAGVSESDSITVLDAGRATLTNGRFKILNTIAGNSAISLEKNGVYTLYADTGSGNLGIGTSSPGAKLHVVQASSAALGAQIALHNTAASAIGNAVEISLLTDAGASPSGIRNGRIRVVNENVGDGRASMQFWTWNGSTDVERARITSGGNFAVGESSSTEVITARRDGTGQYTTIQAKNANSTAVLNVGVGGSLVGNTPLRNNAYVMNASSSSLVFGTGDIERARITSGGDFAIGTSVPYAKLHVSGTAVLGAPGNPITDSTPQFSGTYFSFDGPTNACIIQAINPSTAQFSFHTKTESAAPSERFRITPVGDLAKITTTGIDGTFDNLIKYGTAADIGSGTAQANRWIGIDASVTAGASVANVLRIRAYPGGTSNLAPVNVADFRGDQSTILYGKFDVITSSNKKIQVKDATHDTLTTNLGSAITFSRPTDGSDDLSALFTVDNGGLVLAAREGLIFATGGTTQYSATTERARITSGGDLLVGLTTPTASRTSSFRTGVSGYYCLAAEHSHVSNPLGLSILYTSSIPNGTGNLFLDCGDQTNQRAAIRSNGGIANYSANDVSLSDRREKTNFAPAKSYLDTICAIPVQTFNYIDQSEDDPGLTLGVVAQDVQAVAPEFVHESNWGTEEEPKMRLSIYQTDMQYALMKCIQELKAQNDALLSRIEALESKLPE